MPRKLRQTSTDHEPNILAHLTVNHAEKALAIIDGLCCIADKCYPCRVTVDLSKPTSVKSLPAIKGQSPALE